MNRSLALFVEWHWSQGQLNKYSDLQGLAENYFEGLKRKFPSQAGLRSLALLEIEKAALKSYQKLTYGGGREKPLSAERIFYIRKQLSFFLESQV